MMQQCCLAHAGMPSGPHARHGLRLDPSTPVHLVDGCLTEVYGLGKSERLLGDFQKQTNTSVKVATKFAPLPWRFTEDAPVKALKVRLRFFAPNALPP